jgi:hypothetical protein
VGVGVGVLVGVAVGVGVDVGVLVGVAVVPGVGVAVADDDGRAVGVGVPVAPPLGVLDGTGVGVAAPAGRTGGGTALLLLQPAATRAANAIATAARWRGWRRTLIRATSSNEHTRTIVSGLSKASRTAEKKRAACRPQREDQSIARVPGFPAISHSSQQQGGQSTLVQESEYADR